MSPQVFGAIALLLFLNTLPFRAPVLLLVALVCIFFGWLS